MDASSVTAPVSTENNNNLFSVPAQNEYDSADTAVVTAISTVNKTISFYNYDLKKNYTLNYSNATRFADRYDTAITVKSLEIGSVVDILFMKYGKKLVSLRVSSDITVMKDVTNFSIDTKNGVFKYKSENFEITDGTVLVSEGNELGIADLCGIDTVTLAVKDSSIYSIHVTTGHGYLSLEQSDNFIGGYLEINSKQIEQIKEKMLLVLPEGETNVRITKNATVADRVVTIKPNTETVLSLKDIELIESKTGKVMFEVTPANARLDIDGKSVNPDEIQVLGFGRHRLIANATGYEELIRYFVVGEDMATLKVILNETTSSGTQTSSEASTSTTDEKDGTLEEDDPTAGYFVYITTPTNAEVYVDNYYVGKSPVMIRKESGNHIITLKRTGYVTKTVNVSIANEEGDVTYTFDELEVDVSVNLINGLGGLTDGLLSGTGIVP